MTSRRSPLHGSCASILAALVSSCSPPPEPPPVPVSMPVFVVEASRASMGELVELLPAELDAGLRVVADPLAAMAASTEGDVRIAIVVDATADAESYVLEQATGGYVVRGGAPLGVQYGIAHLLEAMDVRFFHPWHAFVPAALATPGPATFGVEHAPEMNERGLHLHVLHPIEAYFDFWRGEGEDDFEGARRTLQWLVLNRGNYLTWTALDDIVRNATRREAWRAHTRRIVDLAHARGIRVGIGVQLFGGASLQHALVLVPTATDPATSIPERLALFGDLPFDAVHVSFGEFSGEDPPTFIATLDLAYDRIVERFVGAEVTGTVHVGDFPDTRITYMGESMLYYFLVRFASRPIIPWIHTVMYYDLFEDPGGSYNHDDYDEHRAYLLERLAAHEDVAYHPETAYWIAFDDSVPTYLPLYVRSRHHDLTEIRAATRAAGGAELERHVVFSSGWEWGYWQSDWAVLRMSWELPAEDDELYAEMFAPLGGGAELASIVNDLAELQHEHLLVGRLAAYLGSTDGTFALGRSRGFWAQPLRPELAEVVLYDATAQADFRARVLDPLTALREGTRALLARFDAAAVDAAEPFTAEIRDGIEIDVARTEFAVALWSVALARAAGAPTDPLLVEARAARDRARGVVERRRVAMHDPDAAELVATSIRTAGLYQYGYLREADTLCFYERELAQLENALGAALTVPGCVL